MGRIILITGGQRSGKSNYAENMALSLSDHPLYIATARVWDSEFSRRIEKHKASRGAMWINIEEEKFLSNVDVKSKVAVIDCVTLWATNFYYDSVYKDSQKEYSIKDILEDIKQEFNKFISIDSTLIFVTNEIGLGGVSENKAQREFTDLLGWLNQYVASKADEVVFMLSGIAVKIK